MNFKLLGLLVLVFLQATAARVLVPGELEEGKLKRTCLRRVSQLDLLLARLGSVILRLYWNHFTGSPSSLEFILRLFCLLLSAFMD